MPAHQQVLFILLHTQDCGVGRHSTFVNLAKNRGSFTSLPALRLRVCMSCVVLACSIAWLLGGLVSRARCSGALSWAYTEAGVPALTAPGECLRAVLETTLVARSAGGEWGWRAGCADGRIAVEMRLPLGCATASWLITCCPVPCRGCCGSEESSPASPLKFHKEQEPGQTSPEVPIIGPGKLEGLR